MERYNFKSIESKWQKFWEKINPSRHQTIKLNKNFIVWKCFLIHRVKYTWGMLETTL